MAPLKLLKKFTETPKQGKPTGNVIGRYFDPNTGKTRDMTISRNSDQRAPIQKNVVMGANPGGFQTRSEAMSDLRTSAQRTSREFRSRGADTAPIGRFQSGLLGTRLTGARESAQQAQGIETTGTVLAEKEAQDLIAKEKERQQSERSKKIQSIAAKKGMTTSLMDLIRPIKTVRDVTTGFSTDPKIKAIQKEYLDLANRRDLLGSQRMAAKEAIQKKLEGLFTADEEFVQFEKEQAAALGKFEADTEEQREKRAREFSFGGGGVDTQTDVLNRSLNLPSGARVENVNGKFTVVDDEDQFDFETDPLKRAQSQLNRQISRATYDIDKAYDPAIKQLEGETDIRGKLSTQQRKRIGKLERERRDRINRATQDIETRKEELLINEKARQDEIERKILEGEDPARQKAKAKAAEDLQRINELIETGVANSIGHAQNIIKEMDKTIKGRTDKEIESSLIQKVSSGEIQSADIVARAAAAFDGSIEKGIGFATGLGVKEEEIAKQKREYQTNVLRLDSDIVEATDKIDGLKKQMIQITDGQGDEFSMSNAINALKEQDSTGFLLDKFLNKVLESSDSKEINKKMAIQGLENLQLEKQKKVAAGVRARKAISGKEGDTATDKIAAATGKTAREIGDSPADAFDRNVLIGTLTTEMFGKTASNKERDFVQETVDLGQAADMSIDTIRNKLAGFDPSSENEAFSNTIRDLVISEGDRQFNIAQSGLLNRGNKKQVVLNVENKLLGGVDNKLADLIATKDSVIKEKKVLNLLKKVDPEDLGAFDKAAFKFEKFTGGFFDSKEKIRNVQALQTALVGLMTPYRKENIGSQVTQAELALLEPLIASIGDQPEVLEAKIKGFIDGIVESHNAKRSAVGLPMINRSQVLDTGKRISLYEGIPRAAKTEEAPIVTPIKTTKLSDKALEYISGLEKTDPEKAKQLKLKFNLQ